MTRLVSKAENWETIYKAYNSINFTAFDYDSVKKSLLDYLKLYFSEIFSDYIENSELVMQIEAFAYASELYAYRLDQNANENLITTAQRKESILRLAKLISYNVSRNIPARGLVKVSTISTTERIFDSRGNNLSNVVIAWDDPNNANWKEQFLLVVNNVLSQDFGSVLPSDRVQVEDVLFELYSLNNNPLQNNVIRYSINIPSQNTTANSQTFPMELVSTALNQYGPYEATPQKGLALTILYLSDGLGDSSDNTGFFFFTKQGQLQRIQTTFDGVTPNQTYDILVDNINETDVWLNNIDPDTGLVLNNSDLLNQFPSGEWIEVDGANGQNIIFNTNPNPNKYELETLADDEIRFLFGDGNFANIPSGTFEIWFRSSANVDFVINTNVLQNVAGNFTYYDDQNKQQTFAFTFSLIDPIQNSAPSEDIEHIRQTAPALYYTQDRMVNGRDYNVYPLQDNSIIKIQAINRTFAGDSKYIYWHDASEYYENVKIFGDDLVVYFTTQIISTHIPSSVLPPPDGGADIDLINALTYNYIQPVLQTNDFYINTILNGGVIGNVRTTFNTMEILTLQSNLNNLVYNVPETLYMVYNVSANAWTFTETEPALWWISITSNTDQSWDLNYYSKQLICHSDETKFWVDNNGNKTITTDTFNTNLDEIVILSANIASNGSILGINRTIDILSQQIITAGVESGTYSINDVVCIPSDTTGTGVPDDITLSYLINPDLNYVYFNRTCNNGTCPWIYQPGTTENIAAYNQDQANIPPTNLWKREIGVENINFLWQHYTPLYHLVDPSPSNIIDMFVLTKDYYTLYSEWLTGNIANEPSAPTPFELRASYGYLLENAMISDTVILQPAKIKLLFGANADPTVQASFKVVQAANSTITANQIKNTIVNAVTAFFDITLWNFGETFYFTELAAYIHTQLPLDISSIVIVPLYENNVFGDLFQILIEEDQIVQAQVTVANIDIVDSLDPTTLQQFS